MKLKDPNDFTTVVCECGYEKTFEIEEIDFELSTSTYQKLEKTFHCPNCGLRYNRFSIQPTNRSSVVLFNLVLIAITIALYYWGSLTTGILTIVMWGLAVFLTLIILLSWLTTPEELDSWKINRNNLHSLLEDYNPEGSCFIHYDNNNGIIMDKDKAEFCLIYSYARNNNHVYSYDRKLIRFEDIVSSEVIMDGELVTRTNRGSQLAGAALGGAIFGRAGAAVGALSAKTTTEEEIKNIDIMLTLNDMDNPIWKINFLYDFDHVLKRPMKNGHRKDSKEFRLALHEVELWQGLFNLVLSFKK